MPAVPLVCGELCQPRTERPACVARNATCDVRRFSLEVSDVGWQLPSDSDAGLLSAMPPSAICEAAGWHASVLAKPATSDSEVLCIFSSDLDAFAMPGRLPVLFATLRVTVARFSSFRLLRLPSHRCSTDYLAKHPRHSQRDRRSASRV